MLMKLILCDLVSVDSHWPGGSLRVTHCSPVHNSEEHTACMISLLFPHAILLLLVLKYAENLAAARRFLHRYGPDSETY